MLMIIILNSLIAIATVMIRYEFLRVTADKLTQLTTN